MTDLETLAALLARHRIRFGTERQMQDDIEQILEAAGIVAAREHRLLPGPIDFLAFGGIGIECKVAGSNSEVFRQCRGYLGCEECTALLLVTSRGVHRQLPDVLGGKPTRVLWVATASL